MQKSKLLGQVVLLGLISLPLYGEDVNMVGFKKDTGNSILPRATQPIFSQLQGNFQLGSGLYQPSAAWKSINAKKDEVDCSRNQSGEVLGPRLSNFVVSLDTVLNVTSCLSIKKSPIEKFSENNCNMLVECSKSKTSKDVTESNVANIYISRMIAEDFVGMRLEDNLKKMESIDQLRKFSEKKYGKDFVKDCSSPFNYDPKLEEGKNNCDASLIDNGFLRTQKNCQSPNKGCYSPGIDPAKEYPGFADKFKSENNRDSAFQSFFINRNENLVNDSLVNDSELLESISSVMSSQGKIDDKIQKIITNMGKLHMHGKLDPAFSFDSDFLYGSPAVSKKSAHYEFFAKMLARPINSAQARSAIEAYRKEYSKNVLTKNCSTVPTFTQICNSATFISKSNTLEQRNRADVAAKMREDKDDVRFEQMKVLYPRGVVTKDDYNIVLDAQRCKAFGFTPHKKDYYSDLPGTVQYPLLPSLVGLNSPYNYEISYTPPSSAGVKETTDFSKVHFLGFSDTKKDLREAIPSESMVSGSATDSVPLKKPEELSTLSNTFSQGLKDSASSVSSGLDYQAANFNSGANFNNFNDSSASGKNLTDSIAAKPEETQSAETKALNDKISDLTKKLSLAEENIDRIKSEKEAAALAAEQQRKVDDENKSIADLKSQIADLKAQNIKSEKISSENSSRASLASAESTATTPKVATTSQEVSSAESTNAKKSISEADAQSGGRGNFSAANESSTNAASTGRSPAQASGSSSVASAKSSFVLTKVDGLSEEKVAETINEKIMESDGLPFEIEEGGMVKQIVPIIKDGKVLLDDKGHPRYEKVVKRKVAKKEVAKARTPASIDNSADLKRDEEEKIKYERAEYLRLKKLTKEALEKK